MGEAEVEHEDLYQPPILFFVEVVDEDVLQLDHLLDYIGNPEDQQQADEGHGLVVDAQVDYQNQQKQNV